MIRTLVRHAPEIDLRRLVADCTIANHVEAFRREAETVERWGTALVLPTIYAHQYYVPDYSRPPVCMGGIGARRALLTARTPILTPMSQTLTGSGTTSAASDMQPGSMYIEMIAAGGGGKGGVGGGGAGGGGGGGAYSAGASAVTPGQTGIAYDCGTGGSGTVYNTATQPTNGGDATWNGGEVLAQGGRGANNRTGGAGGAAASSTGTTKVDGSTGGTGVTGAGVPGGTGGDGASGGTLTGGAGGPGADGATAGANGSTSGAKSATAPGGGGGGGRSLTNGTGTPGAAGTIKKNWIAVS